MKNPRHVDSTWPGESCETPCKRGLVPRNSTVNTSKRGYRCGGDRPRIGHAPTQAPAAGLPARIGPRELGTFGKLIGSAPGVMTAWPNHAEATHPDGVTA